MAPESERATCKHERLNMEGVCPCGYWVGDPTAHLREPTLTCSEVVEKLAKCVELRPDIRKRYEGQCTVFMGESRSGRARSMSDPLSDEVLFAEGKEIETQNIRVTYKALQLSKPDKKFPRVYKTNADGSVDSIGLTPDEGYYLAAILTQLVKGGGSHGE